MAGLDAYATEFLARHSSPPIEAIMGVVSAWHAPGGIVTLTALAALVLLWRRDGLGLLMLLSSVLGGATLNHMLKHGFQRPRPGMEHLPAAVTDFAFPSGHAANATLLYGACVVLLVPHLSARWARAAAVFGALLWVGLVSGSRVLLGAHRLSDVLGGMLLGLAWLALCMAATAALERIKAGR
jgi:undecaprenyl-diphosphatase